MLRSSREKEKTPAQSICSCLVPLPFEYNGHVYCKKCGYKINDSLDQVIITGNTTGE